MTDEAVMTALALVAPSPACLGAIGTAQLEEMATYNPMTGGELRKCLDAMHWRPTTLAAVLQCDEALIRMMISGDREIDRAVADYIRPIAAVHLALPPPPPDVWMRRKRKSA
jgi:hypothetical protein